MATPESGHPPNIFHRAMAKMVGATGIEHVTPSMTMRAWNLCISKHRAALDPAVEAWLCCEDVVFADFLPQEQLPTL
jgi:hypothetical protein